MINIRILINLSTLRDPIIKFAIQLKSKFDANFATMIRRMGKIGHNKTDCIRRNLFGSIDVNDFYKSSADTAYF